MEIYKDRGDVVILMSSCYYAGGCVLDLGRVRGLTIKVAICLSIICIDMDTQSIVRNNVSKLQSVLTEKKRPQNRALWNTIRKVRWSRCNILQHNRLHAFL